MFEFKVIQELKPLSSTNSFKNSSTPKEKIYYHLTCKILIVNQRKSIIVHTKLKINSVEF
ncbi:MAG: hypothetical protein RSA91_07445 [Bacilli bacterium]